MKKPFSVFCVLSASLSVSSNLYAEASTMSSEKLDEIVVISSKVEQPLREIGASVSVLTEDDLTMLAGSSLSDALRTLPAINVSNSGGVGKVTTLRIRGEEGYRTMVMVDGMDIADVSTPQTSVQIDQIMAAGIGRVEVLRGPQGMMYGSDAGGVVNISTQQLSEGFSAQIGGEAGRYDSRRVFGQAGYANEKVDAYISAANLQTDGFNSTTTDVTSRDDDGYENATYHARVSVMPQENWTLKAVLRKTAGENQYDNCFNVSNDCENHYDQFNKLISASYEDEKFSNEIQFQQNDIERENFSDGVGLFQYFSELNRINYTAHWKASDWFSLLGGADYKTETFESTFDPEFDRSQIGYFAELQTHFSNQLYVNLGLRHDDNDSVGKFTNYRFTAAKLFSFDSVELKLKTSASSGFRAPSLYEIASNNGPFAGPPATDASLKEETSQGYDGGFELFFGQGLHIEMVYFDQTTQDKIYYDPVSFSGYLQDDGESQSKGIESSINWSMTDYLTVAANFTRNTSENADGSVRARRPKNFGNVRIDSTLLNEKLRVGLLIRYSGDYQDIDNSDVDGYRVLDLHVNYDVIENFNVYLKLYNALDEEYVEVPSFNTAARSASVGLQYRF